MKQLFTFKNMTITYWPEGSSFVSLWREGRDTFIRLGKMEVLLGGGLATS